MIHISQLLEATPGNEPGIFTGYADGDQGLIHILIKQHKSKKFWIAKSAHEYWIEADDTENDGPVDLEEALLKMAAAVPGEMANVDQQFSVTSDRDQASDLAPLVWFTGPKGKRQGRTLLIKRTEPRPPIVEQTSDGPGNRTTNHQL